MLIHLLFLVSSAVAVSVGKVTETTIALDFAVNEVVERFGVKWKRDQTVPQELPSTNGGLVIGGLSANIVYMFNVTAQLPGGKERSSVVNVSTIGKWYWYLAVFWLEM